MTLGFVETRLFMSVRDEYFGSDASYAALQQALLENPAAGAVIRGAAVFARYAGLIRGAAKANAVACVSSTFT